MVSMLTRTSGPGFLALRCGFLFFGSKPKSRLRWRRAAMPGFSASNRKAARPLALWLLGFLALWLEAKKLGVWLFGFAAWLFGFLARKQKAVWLGLFKGKPFLQRDVEQPKPT